ncbi:MAG: Enoyl-[acyl-carrier-protein] reductase [FMN] (EC [uncultured Campylobacterales bacterium]|uniref:Enoyl-[acyl-carrier-protein] reductase [FMN] (EC) n=1 Tax=uncultured Campylobacterales bacterium TaxID=352960 RepID=A0A6S6S2B5_9BACT|nr:MAG: Enoyl-[acyl-carrier-protein] reductase [FMN] (EC [uncultured Campylobacterales bacterium]
MELKPIKIGKYEIKVPIFQGGMGVGISWDQLAGSVSKTGALGIISAVGTGYYKKQQYIQKSVKDKPYNTMNFYSKDALFEIFKNARKICGDAPIGCNILHAINDYDRVVVDACEAGANMIITGAGLPTNMPGLTKDYPDVALIPIVSSPKALRILVKRWMNRYDRLPDAIIVEGPLSGGHQGFSYDDCLKEENQLENIVPAVKEELLKYSDKIPLIAAGGVWDHDDIARMIERGADGVQMGTRFIATHECDTHQNMKDILIKSKKEDIKLFKSPVGYPARGVHTRLFDVIKTDAAPKVRCISNCVTPCHSGVEAKAVGYCIADRLSDAHNGIVDTGLFFSGANGYKIDKIISVQELVDKLVHGE